MSEVFCQLSGPTAESLRVERRGNLVWKWFRPKPMVDHYHWFDPQRWRHQLRLRIEASRTLRIPIARLNPVVWFDDASLRWATPFVYGRSATAAESLALCKSLDSFGFGFIDDVNEKNIIVDERFDGLVIIDFQIYERGYDAFKSVTMKTPPVMNG